MLSTYLDSDGLTIFGRLSACLSLPVEKITRVHLHLVLDLNWEMKCFAVSYHHLAHVDRAVE